MKVYHLTLLRRKFGTLSNYSPYIYQQRAFVVLYVSLPALTTVARKRSNLSLGKG